jgi:hypothetical protein
VRIFSRIGTAGLFEYLFWRVFLPELKEPSFRWFLLIFGIGFLALAGREGRELAFGLDGPWTPEERAADAREHTFAWRVIGGTVVALALWKFATG